MKKILPIKKQRLIAVANNRYLKKLRRRKKSVRPRFRRKFSLTTQVQRLREKFPAITIRFKRGRIAISAPSKMRRSESEDEVMQFLNCLRELIHIKARLSVDFTTIQDMSPLCAMLLVSEVHRWQLIRKQRLRVIDGEAWNPKIQRLLYDIGLFNLIDLTNPLRMPAAEHEPEENFIRIRSENEVHLETAVKNIEEQVAKVAILLNNDPAIYGGIEEAVTNVTQWAYPPQDKDPDKALSKRWWFCASFNKKTGRMTIMVYDHGVGIPKTLPTSKWNEAVKKFFSDRNLYDWTDDKILEAAMTIPRSASGHEYRAKGLQKMKGLLRRFSRGELRILSGFGEYRVDHNGDGKTELHRYSIGGTLIIWEVWEKVK